ncbi:MAG: hypothetical protein QXL94_07985 [Candidatus Parvarchaeum sp.]
MAYKKSGLENRLLLNYVKDLAPAKKQLFESIFELNQTCEENHEHVFVDNLEKLVYGIKDALNLETRYRIEEIAENLEFIYRLKGLKEGYRFGNLPEETEEKNIAELYKLIADSCEKLNPKQISLAAGLIHYLSTSERWERVNYLRFME